MTSSAWNKFLLSWHTSLRRSLATGTNGLGQQMHRAKLLGRISTKARPPHITRTHPWYKRAIQRKQGNNLLRSAASSAHTSCHTKNLMQVLSHCDHVFASPSTASYVPPSHTALTHILKSVGCARHLMLALRLQTCMIRKYSTT